MRLPFPRISGNWSSRYSSTRQCSARPRTAHLTRRRRVPRQCAATSSTIDCGKSPPTAREFSQARSTAAEATTYLGIWFIAATAGSEGSAADHASRIVQASSQQHRGCRERCVLHERIHGVVTVRQDPAPAIKTAIAILICEQRGLDHAVDTHEVDHHYAPTAGPQTCILDCSSNSLPRI